MDIPTDVSYVLENNLEVISLATGSYDVPDLIEHGADLRLSEGWKLNGF